MRIFSLEQIRRDPGKIRWRCDSMSTGVDCRERSHMHR
jgi:hypothetical protein